MKLRLTKATKQWLVNRGAATDLPDHQYRKLASKAIRDGSLTMERLARLQGTKTMLTSGPSPAAVFNGERVTVKAHGSVYDNTKVVAKHAKLGTPIDDQIANLIVAQLLHLESEDPDKDISIYINSPGGSVYSGLAIYDTMQFIKPDVQTICVGIAMSMGALLLAGGSKGKRMALPNAKILIHQVWGGFQGQATDIEIHTKEILDARDRLNKILSHHTGQPIDKIRLDTDRDNFMSGEQAKAYGLIDSVLDRRGQLPAVNPDK